ncbi:MAG: hypothetical protein Q8P59_08720, partial [Dehalococcoidia bacterium]|nr:hypothetical protein [Dehalococcoidia bacterium]
AAGYQLLYTPDVSVWHHRRSSSSALFRQLYRYGIGRLQLGKRAPGMINLVHTGVGLSLPLGMVILLGSLLISPILTAALLSTVVATLAFFAIWGLIATRSLASAALIPYVIVLVAVAWSLGFVREAVAPVRVRSQEKALQLP